MRFSSLLRRRASRALAIGAALASVAIAPATASADTQATVAPEIFVDSTTVACTRGVWTNSPMTWEYVIVRDETVQVTSPSASHLYSITDADRGHLLACVVKATNVAGEVGYAASPSVRIEAAAPAPTLPVAPGSPAPAPEAVALSAGLQPAAGQRLRSALRNGVRATATCSRACTMTVTLRRGKKVVGKAKKAISGGSAKLVIRFSASAARALRSASRVPLTLEYSTAAGDEQRTGSTSLTLKR